MKAEQRLRQLICDYAYLMVQLNVREEKDRANRGEVVDVIQLHAAESRGYAWCVALADFVVDKACQRLMVNSPFHIGVSSSRLVREARKLGRLITDPAKVQAGDLFVRKGGDTGFNHAGIVLSVLTPDHEGDVAHMRTVEGNTNEAGSAEGDGVYSKVRKLSSEYYVWVDVASAPVG